ncbi:sugar phosphate isomerase/epimerase family protein [Enterococcus sp. HY326]|uniref:sugar phosphate isomerase/epimerase family protein n=1 Tax=Enterococcus sp. HY326 TaxID=2971265 RepID=UPI00223EACD4|nr:hypothetical protein [Enterococcus sp. HY326]
MGNIFVNTIVKEGTPYQDQTAFVKALAELPLSLSGIEVRREYFSKIPAEKQQEFLEILETGKLKNWQLRYSIPEPLFVADGLNPDLSEWLAEAESLAAVSMKLNIGSLAGLQKVSRGQLEKLLPKELTVTIENDQTEENGKLAAVLKALTIIEEQQLPLGYTFDLGNWVVMGEDPEAAFQQVKEKITIFHLKNIFQGQPVLLDQGELNWRKFLAPEWPTGIEYPMSLMELEQEYQKVQEVIENG